MKRLLPIELVRPVSLLLEDLGTPFSLSQAIKLRYEDWVGLAESSVDPRLYLDSSHYARDNAAASILKKCSVLPTSRKDRRKRCVDKWWDGERSCYLANERLSRYLPERGFASFSDRDPVISEMFSEVRKIVAGWIGAGPSELAIGRFGPGTTFSDRGGKSTVPDKMTSNPSLTSDAVWYLPQWFGTQWGAAFAQRQGELLFVPGNRFATVPKTAITDRGIASEPALNVFYQLALGRQLRKKLLLKAGWDMDRAQEIHQQVARESSVTREFATLDLSNASDTVCKNLVRILLPHLWFSALDDLRSKKTLIDRKWVVLEKFSSMGNGFTFELETIIFAALSCWATRKCGFAGELAKDVFIFGDDIIVRDPVVKLLNMVLTFCGFSLNMEKSYWGDVPFRESCGGDFYAGKPVRGYYLKDSLDGPEDHIAFANGIRALRERLELSGFKLPLRSWLAALDSLPSRIRDCRGPQGLGDIVIHDEERFWKRRWRGQIGWIRCYRPARFRVKRYERYHPDVQLACATYGGTDNIKLGGVTPRDGVLGYKVGWVACS